MNEKQFTGLYNVGTKSILKDPKVKILYATYDYTAMKVIFTVQYSSDTYMHERALEPISINSMDGLPIKDIEDLVTASMDTKKRSETEDESGIDKIK
jgi:hypothetical protein